MTNKLTILPNKINKTLRLGKLGGRTLSANYADQSYIVSIPKAHEATEFLRVAGTGTMEWRVDISPGYDGFDEDDPTKDFIWFEKKATAAVATGATVEGTLVIDEIWAKWVRVQLRLATLLPEVDFFLTGIDRGN